MEDQYRQPFEYYSEEMIDHDSPAEQFWIANENALIGHYHDIDEEERHRVEEEHRLAREEEERYQETTRPHIRPPSRFNTKQFIKKARRHQGRYKRSDLIRK